MNTEHFIEFYNADFNTFMQVLKSTFIFKLTLFSNLIHTLWLYTESYPPCHNQKD